MVFGNGSGIGRRVDEVEETLGLLVVDEDALVVGGYPEVATAVVLYVEDSIGN